MRYAILISILVCGACVALRDFAGHSERAGAKPRPATIMQPPVTQAELDTLCATRAAAIEKEQAPRPPVEPVASPATQPSPVDARLAEGTTVGADDGGHGALWGQ